jgi:hypothetical protein
MTEIVLPTPTLDHVVVNARDRMDEAAACYRRLGFALTPRGRHTLGTINHLAIFGTDYLELIGLEPGVETVRGEILRAPFGLNGLVFGTEDSLRLYGALKQAGLAVAEPVEFSRPVEMPNGTEDARFRVVRMEPSAAPYGRVYFCHHFTRHLVWRDEWRHHANGAVGVARAVICAAAPDATAELYRRMFGRETVRPMAGGFTLTVGMSRFDILSPAAVAEGFGAALPDAAGRTTYLVGLGFRVRRLDDTERALDRNGVRLSRERARLVVPASEAFGATIEFVE